METPKASRKPLQPRKQVNTERSNSKPPKGWLSAAAAPQDSNKENHHPLLLIHPNPPPPKVVTGNGTWGASLGEELSAVRKKLERLRAEREETEKLLAERGRRLECELRDILERGEIQKILELEVDRLYRLKQLHSHSLRISPVRSLRDKEQDRKEVTHHHHHHHHHNSPPPPLFQLPPPSPSSSSSSSSRPIPVN